MTLWGVIGLAFVPWEPFGIPNLAQAVVGPLLLGYLVASWNRPHTRIDWCIIALAIVYTSVRLPWATVWWSRLERPLESFTVPQLAAVAIGLMWPGRFARGIVVIWLFCAQALFAFFYARHLGQSHLIPITEPLATFSFPIIGFGLLYLRQRSRELAQQHARARGELQALERIRPLFTHAREVLEAQVDALAVEIRSQGAREAGERSKIINRSLDRLSNLRHKLGNLVASEQAPPSLQEAERQLLEHDAQLGAIMASLLVTVITVPSVLTFISQVGTAAVPTLTSLFVIAGVLLSYLVVTRRHPSSRRAVVAVVVLYVIALPIIDINQFWVLEVGRPYAPFLGHKLVMSMLGLTLATRFRLGAGLIIFAGLNAVVIWFVLDLGAHRDLVETSEPFPTLIYMLVGLSALRRGERRQQTSIQLLRDEAEAAAMHRRALMFLALRDQLNSPVQTLVLGAAGRGARAREAIEQLVELSRQLAEVDVPMPQLSGSVSLDAERELRHQLLPGAEVVRRR